MIKSPKSKVVDHVKTLKCKNNFAKGYLLNWSEKVFVIKKAKNTVSWTFVISDVNINPVGGGWGNFTCAPPRY